MSSPYAKLGNRSLDQWKVTELKEELKRRRLPIKGLKEDLVKRLDEAVRMEMDNSMEKADNGSVDAGQSELLTEQVMVGFQESQRAEDPQDIVVDTVERKVGGDNAKEVDGDNGSLQEAQNVDANVVHKTQNEAMEIKDNVENDGSESEQPNNNDQPMNYQVSAVDPDLGIQVKSDSVSTEPVPIIGKNELNVDINTDNVNLELDVKHEMEQQSLISAVPGDGESHPMDVEETLYKKEIEETGHKNIDSVQDLSIENLGPEEKLNLEGNSGDDAMGEGSLEDKEIDNKSSLNENEGNKKSDLPKEEEDVDVVVHDKPVYFKGPDVKEETVPVPEPVKRKFNDQEGIGNNDAPKKPRRLNLEGSKASEPQIGNIVSSSTPTPKTKDLSVPNFKYVTGNDPANNEEAPKERHVPPSVKPPTNSLRVDRFLRPFTLKAVQELLGKTGTVTDFWMDQIKTHCYVSYSSVEEAIETRNAVYNLQWPTNGGRLLIAEFVDPQEVKSRLEAPPSTPSSATPTSSTPKTQQSLQAQKHHLPVPPPPPVLSEPPLARDRPPPVKDRLGLPPPPLAPEKVEPPILTLDDLFRKTKATPRIYYLPLSDVEVDAKLKSQGNNAN